MPQFTPFMGTAIALAVGIATFRLLPGNEIPFICVGISAICSMLMVKLLKLSRQLKRPVLLLGNLCWSLASGYLLMHTNWPPNQEGHYLQLNQEGSPQPMLIEVIRRERSSENYHKYTARVLQIGDHRCQGEVLLRSRRNNSRQLEAGDRIELVGTLKRPFPALNPGQFDYRAYLESQGLFHLLDLHRSTIVHCSSAGRNWRKRLDGLKEQLHQRLGQTKLKPEHKAILNGMLLGDRGDIDQELLQSYSRAGVMHLLAISGLHVGLLYLALGWLLRPLWLLPNGYRICPVIIAGMLWSYAFFTGLSPSVVRATTVFSLFSLSRTFYRYPQSLSILALAFYLLLIIKPIWLFQAGFQMSFLAVLGILLLHPLLSKTVILANSWLRYVRDMLSVSLAAQIGVLPVSLYYFHQFPLAFLLANLLAIPLMTPLLISGLLLLFFGSLGEPPDSIISIFGWLVDLLNAWVRFLSGPENWVLTDIPFSGLSVALAYTSIALWYLVFSRPTRSRFSLGCWLSIPLGVLLLVDQYTVPSKELAVLHSYGNTIVVGHDGGQLTLWTDQPVNDQRLLGALRRKYRASKTTSHPLPALIEVDETWMLTIDSMGIYPKLPEIDVLLLSGNPRVHLELILRELCPEQVVADGSNYPSLADRWEQTCREMGIPYHHTASQGAYITYP
jgi:competence protein ComEC